MSIPTRCLSLNRSYHLHDTIAHQDGEDKDICCERYLPFGPTRVLARVRRTDTVVLMTRLNVGSHRAAQYLPVECRDVSRTELVFSSICLHHDLAAHTRRRDRSRDDWGGLYLSLTAQDRGHTQVGRTDARMVHPRDARLPLPNRIRPLGSEPAQRGSYHRNERKGLHLGVYGADPPGTHQGEDR